jgi:hypothetical protein
MGHKTMRRLMDDNGGYETDDADDSDGKLLAVHVVLSIFSYYQPTITCVPIS